MGSGYYDRSHDDLCYRDFQVHVDEGVMDYNLFLPAHMRMNVEKCHPLSQDKQCDFWGPLRGKRVTQDSFLSGRGQSLSDCPDCDVFYLPESIFPNKPDPGDFAYEQQTGKIMSARCQRTDLEPLYTRKPRSCNGLSETDISQYAFMPSAWQKGYTGYRSVVDTNLQSRQALQDLSVTNGGLAYPECRTNYGSFDSGPWTERYA